MYEIYSLDYQQAASLLTPPDKRNPKWLAFLNACLKPVQWLRDLAFNDYAAGSSASVYVSGTAYNLGDRVRWTDFAVYELINPFPADTTGIDTSPANSAYWYKVLDHFIGLRERMRYNSQQLLLEYALNRYFGTTYTPPNSYSGGDYAPKSEIYIQRNSVDTDGFIIGNSEQATASINASDLLYFNNCIGTNYITAAQNNFIIHIPSDLAGALEDYVHVVKAFANQYVVYGMIYDVKSP